MYLDVIFDWMVNIDHIKTCMTDDFVKKTSMVLFIYIFNMTCS